MRILNQNPAQLIERPINKQPDSVGPRVLEVDGKEHEVYKTSDRLLVPVDCCHTNRRFDIDIKPLDLEAEIRAHRKACDGREARG